VALRSSRARPGTAARRDGFGPRLSIDSRLGEEDQAAPNRVSTPPGPPFLGALRILVRRKEPRFGWRRAPQYRLVGEVLRWVRPDASGIFNYWLAEMLPCSF